MSGIMSMLLGAVSSAAAAVDEFFNRVTLLLPGNGTNGAQNNTFLDSSSNNFTITRNGNTTQGTFSPFSQTGWSNWLPTSGNENIAVTTANSAFALGTGDFTIEGWFYLTNPTYAQGLCHINTAVNTTVNGYAFGITSAGLLQFYANATFTNTNVTLAANTWYHIALVKSSGTVKIYVNGTNPTSGGSSADSQNLGNSVCYVGLFYNTSGYTMTGYASNFRVVKGTAVYTANFASPTTPLTAITNTSFLTCQSNRFVDNSSNALSLTLTGTPSVQAFSPFAPTAAYSAATVGGSGYFDGTGDYLTWSGSSVTTAFTFECWFYYTGTFSAIAAFVGPGTAVTNALNLYINNSTQLTFDQYGVTATSFTVPTMTANQWYHVAFVRNSSNSATVFLNGVRSSTGAVTISTSFANIASIGYVSSAVPRPWIGYLSGVKYSQSAVYDPTQTTITIPTAPPSSSGATLLLNYTNAGITDATAKNDLETVGNAQISTTQSKFGGSSMYFDGTGDYLQVGPSQLLNLGASDFTIEFWIYPTSFASTSYPMYSTTARAKSDVLAFEVSTGGVIVAYITASGGGAWSIVSAGNIGTLTLNAWNHVALVRNGSNFRGYVGGVQGGMTTSSASAVSSFDGFSIGSYVAAGFFTGYIDDLRISRYARYTAAFTPPTSAFALQ